MELCRCLSRCCPRGLETVSNEPGPNACNTPIEPVGHLLQREPRVNERLQLLPGERPTPREPLATRGAQPVPFQPVSNGGGMQIYEIADTFEGKPLSQVRLQCPPIHDPNTSSGDGQN